MRAGTGSDGRKCGSDRGGYQCAPAVMAKNSPGCGSPRVVHHFSGRDYWTQGPVSRVTMMIVCETDLMMMPNSCHCCAERRLIGLLREQARREGVAPAGFAHWLSRKHGEFTVVRLRRDGQPGVSLPCVICRKVLDRMGIRWRAHIGREWVTNENAPPSQPTQKQRACVF